LGGMERGRGGKMRGDSKLCGLVKEGFLRPVLIIGIVLVNLFCFAETTRAEFICGPFEVKLKMNEGEFLEKYSLATGYKTKSWRWNLNAVLYEPMAYDRQSYLKSLVKFKTDTNWWLGGEGRYSFEPACDYWRLRLFSEKRNTKSWSANLWNNMEWRRTNSGYTLAEYAYYEYGGRVRWTPWKKLKLKSELTKRVKDYDTSPNSWTKYDLLVEGKTGYGRHNLEITYKETTGKYPDNAWGNYLSNTLGADWVWDLSDFARIRVDHRRLFKKWGDGKRRIERNYLGVLEYPRGRDLTLGWMVGHKATSGQLVLIDEVKEEDMEAHTRIGLRINKVFSAAQHRVTVELFEREKKEETVAGVMAILRLNCGAFRWECGLAPWGGFNYSAEKGYWIKVRYYF